MIRLLSIETRDWRGLTCRIDDLAPDLNLIVGPNEAGKSRLFEALRFALFERHKGVGKEKERLLTWGSAEPPIVAVTFENEGKRYEIRKQFFKQPSAVLVGDGKTLRDSDAELRLAELLEYRQARRGLTAPNERGIWPLLWLEQGSSGIAPHERLNQDSRARLRDFLAQEIGEIAAGPIGQRILERASEEKSRYYTATGKKTGELGKAIKDLNEALGLRDEASARKKAVYRAANELARAQEENKTLAERVRVRQEAFELARAKASHALRIKGEIETVEARKDSCESRLREAETELRRWTELAEELNRLRNKRSEVERGIDVLKALLDDERMKLQRARESFAVVEAEESHAERAAHRARRLLERRQITARISRLETIRNRALVLAEEIAEIDSKIRQIHVLPETLEALRTADAELTRAEAGLSIAAAHVTVTATQEIMLDGKILASGDAFSCRVIAPKTLSIDEVASVHIEPGGPDLDRVHDRFKQAKDRRDDLLSTCKAASLTEAEALANERVERMAELRIRKERLHEIAPDGAEKLGEDLREQEDRLQTLETEDASSITEMKEILSAEDATRHLGGAASQRDVAAESEDDARAAVRKAEESHRAARALLESSRVDRDTAAVRYENARRDLAEVERELERMNESRRALEDRSLEAPEEEALLEAKTKAAANLKREAERLVCLRSELRDTGGEHAAEDLTREESAFESLRAQASSLEGQMKKLEGELRAHGGESLHEAEEEAETEVALLQEKLEQVTRRAQAALLLFDTLTTARDQAQQRLFAPVVRRSDPLLREVFPGSLLSIGEDWSVRGIETRNIEEPFDDLSGGAKEQVGIIARIALAQVLAGGESLPLVLDDALVSSDSSRRDAMQRVLYRAAKSGLQIVILTCHDVAFDGLGASRKYVLRPQHRSSSNHQ